MKKIMWNRTMTRFVVVLLMWIMVNFSRCSDSNFSSTMDSKSAKEHVDPNDIDNTTYREKIYNEIREKLCQPSIPTENSSSIGLCIRKFDDLPILNYYYSYINPVLLCRGENLINVGWSSNFKNKKNTIYGVDILDVIDDKSSFHLIKDENVTFHNLKPNSNYSICLSLFNQTAQFGKINCKEFWTLPENFVPGTVSNVSIDYSKIKDSKLFISWTPAEDRTCYYEILAYTDLELLSQTQVYVPKDMFFAQMSSFNYGTKYVLGINGLELQERRKSDTYWLPILIPTCIEVHKNLKMCAPEKPMGVNVTEENSTRSSANQDYYDIIINWTTPLLKPDFYIINLISTESDSLIRTKNISGTAVKARIGNVVIGNSYKLTLNAWSSGGKSESTEINRMIDQDPPTLQQKSSSLLSILIPVLSFILIIGLALFIYYRYDRLKRSGKSRQVKTIRQLSNEIIL